MNNSPRDKEIRQWSMFLHFSLLLGLVVPYAGLIAPIVLWQIKKEDLPEINPHGKVVCNWIISLIIYQAVCFGIVFLTFTLFFQSLLPTGNTYNNFFPIFPAVPFAQIGIIWLLLFVFGILNIIFPLIGGIEASNGKVWKYPLALNILN